MKTKIQIAAYASAFIASVYMALHLALSLPIIK